MAIEIINLHRDGASRWNCVCGLKPSPEEAFRHALMGHECVFEVYFGGRWINDGWTVADMILMGKQLKGENVQEFIERTKQIAEREGVSHFADR